MVLSFERSVSEELAFGCQSRRDRVIVVEGVGDHLLRLCWSIAGVPILIGPIVYLTKEESIWKSTSSV